MVAWGFCFEGLKVVYRKRKESSGKTLITLYVKIVHSI